MNTKQSFLNWVLFFVSCLFVLVGCAGETDEVETAVSESTFTPPAEVITVRDAVLEFLRDGANICVPPEGVVWQASSGGEQTPAGYEMVRFNTSDECAVTVTYPQEQVGEPVYHVALGHGVTGFCWQALVDGQGHVLETGVTANNSGEIGNPAKTYCEAQGNEYEVVTTAAGMECGQCIFADGSRCNGWAYLNGACQPGDSLADGG